MNLKVIQKLRNELQKINYKCREWCFECCTVIPFLKEEYKLMKEELLKKWFLTPPNWKWDQYCEFLTSEGKCSVYNQRPLICRSFSNRRFVVTRGEKKIATQSCTYWDPILTPATNEFSQYLEEVNKKGFINENAQYIVKEIVKSNPIFME